jgi:hypothetical protein
MSEKERTLADAPVPDNRGKKLLALCSLPRTDRSACSPSFSLR